MMRTFLLGILTLAGCSSGRHFAIDAHFSADDREMIREAAEAWVDAVGEQGRIDLSDGGAYGADDLEHPHDSRIVQWSPQEDPARSLINAMGIETNGQHVDGFDAHERRPLLYPGGAWELIVISPQLHGLALYRVAMHEFGHALGLGHSPTEGDIMYYEGGTCISNGDARAFCEVNGCTPTHNMGTCSAL